MPSRTKIVLHIGHGKTGTSATQVVLARNAPNLEKMGFLYPHHGSFDMAIRGEVTSGNVPIRQLINKSEDRDHSARDWFPNIVVQRVKKNPGYSTYVFSSEEMFWYMSSVFANFDTLMEEYELKIIMAVREPLEMLSSAYGQRVKGEGYFSNLSEYEPIENHIVHAADNLKNLVLHGIPFEVLNYSFLKRDISKEIFRLIGLNSSEIGQLDLKVEKEINRSLTQTEMSMIKSVNRCFGGNAGAGSSKALLNAFPNISGESVHVPFDVFGRFEKRVNGSVEYVNEFLPVDQRLLLKFLPKLEMNSKLLDEQCHVLFEALKGSVQNQHDQAIAERDHAIAERDHAIAERDHAIAERDHAIAERDHAVRYPWKYVRKAIRLRFQ